MSNKNNGDEILAFISMIILSICWLSLDSNDSIVLKSLVSGILVFITILLFSRDSSLSVVALFIIGICLRFHYISFVNFDDVPYGDAQIDLFMTNVLLENEQITFIKHEIYDDRLLYYSSWPLSQICVVMFASISGLDNLTSTHSMQLFSYLACFLLAYHVFFNLGRLILKGSKKNLRWALLLFIALPELNYWQGEYVRLNLGLLSSYFAIFSLTLMISPKFRLQSSILMILSCVMLGFSHNLTTAISVLSFFLAFLILLGISMKEKSLNDDSTKTFIKMLGNNLALLSIVGIIWWSLVGEVLFPKIQGVIGRYSSILIEGFSLTHDPRIPTPPELSPLWAKFLLYGRDLLLLPTTAIGFLMLSKENLGRSKLPFNFVFSFSMAYFLVFALLFLWAEPFRVLTYASPFMAICFAKFFSSERIWDDSGTSNFSRQTILAIILVAAFLSPNAHTHSPMYFYNDDLNKTEYGLPGENSRRAILFAVENSDPNSTISSDHPDYSIHPVSPKDIDRFFSVVTDVNEDSFGKLEYSPNTEIILLVKGGNLFQLQSAQSTNSSFLEFTEVSQDRITDVLTSNANLGYNQGDGVSIWTIPS